VFKVIQRPGENVVGNRRVAFRRQTDDAFICIPFPHVGCRHCRLHQLAVLEDVQDRVELEQGPWAVGLVDGTDLVVSDDVLPVEWDHHAIDALDLAAYPGNQVDGGGELFDRQFALRRCPDAFVFDADRVQVGIDLAIAHVLQRGLAGVNCLCRVRRGSIAPGRVLDGHQLRDAPILGHDKVCGGYGFRIAEPLDGPGIGALGDVADDGIRLPTVAPFVSVQ